MSRRRILFSPAFMEITPIESQIDWNSTRRKAFPNNNLMIPFRVTKSRDKFTIISDSLGN